LGRHMGVGPRSLAEENAQHDAANEDGDGDADGDAQEAAHNAPHADRNHSSIQNLLGSAPTARIAGVDIVRKGTLRNRTRARKVERGVKGNANIGKAWKFGVKGGIAHVRIDTEPKVVRSGHAISRCVGGRKSSATVEGSCGALRKSLVPEVSVRILRSGQTNKRTNGKELKQKHRC